MGVTRA